MTSIRLASAVFCALLLPVAVEAAECSSDQMLAAVKMLEPAGRELVASHFLGGKQIATAVTDCALSDDGTYEVGASISWSGVLMSWNKYEVQAVFSFPKGVAPSFSVVRGNDKAQELDFWGNVAGRTLSLAGGLL